MPRPSTVIAAFRQYVEYDREPIPMPCDTVYRNPACPRILAVAISSSNRYKA